MNRNSNPCHSNYNKYHKHKLITSAVHSDGGWGGVTANRHLTFTMFLNTITDGGELEFPDQGVKVQPGEGRAAIFPAAWMYAHRSLPATVDRYVFNVFYGYLPQT